MKHSALHTQHKTLGAQFQQIGDWEMPAHYGHTAEEHLTVRQGVGIADLSLRGINRLTGDDRVTWLQNLISNDIRPLAIGQGMYSSLMDHKGKILSYFRVMLLEDSIVLEDAGEVGDITYQHLRKFLLFGTKAKMENCLESWGTLLISGPTAPELINKAFSIDMSDSKLLDFHNIDIEGHSSMIIRTEETGEHDLEILMPIDALVPAWKRLWSSGKPFGLRPVGHTALESLRIEAGIPKVGPDLNDRIVPPEANLEGKAFSLTKGCYPGQEVVARMDTYGSVKRRLVGLFIDSPNNQLPEAGAKIFSGDREVGWVSSSAYSPTFQKPIAMGFPLRDFTKAETELTIEIGNDRYPAVVQSLPFSRSQ